MADSTVPAIQDLDEEAYDSAEDEDFSLDAAQDDSDLSSDADETGEPAEPAKKKRKTDKKPQIPSAELDSGDEATIRKAKEKKTKKSKGTTSKGKRARDSDEDDSDIDMDDDEGGTGGFVRTRAMRKHIQEEERKPLAKIDGATVDVDALWAQMNAPESQAGLTATKEASESAPDQQQTDKPTAQDQDTGDTEQKPDAHAEQMIKIKRTYKFAGEWITEEKVVPKHSAEAKAFLSGGENVEFTEEEAAAANAARNQRRPLRRISRFDPNPTGTIKKSWEKQVVADDKDARGPKINTVEKSRLDWASYVDKAGIEDELRMHSKAKEGYIGRMDFLGRMEDKREEERRAARLKGI
ncbi:uncharacterized protein N7515_007436 [Penicillium bovifimosum]|uniref:SWR1-complex protein 5 n=1 Tax=Penicillium bovifimosum TaxID=126998 RepID=A0A9W9GWL7_9EURO|nr:uncharacterized protein N7515_007436 [Penicillium bovifimosum]KAJ5131397.1 hypothetical protein N7515_007436 [Penicillium bovifimosum]